MIQLSATVRYATRIMVAMARNQASPPIHARTISCQEGIPYDYVAQILLKLKAAGLVASQRGVKGGFLLSCDPRTTTVLDIIQAVEGKLGLAPCSRSICPRTKSCATRLVWDEAVRALKRVFGSTSIAELARMAEPNTVSYEI